MVDLSFNNLVDLTGLEGASIQSLNLIGAGLSNIDSLNYVINIEELNLDVNKLTDIKGLKGLSTLKYLTISENPGLSFDLDGEIMPNMEIIVANDIGLTSVTEFLAFPNLEFLNIPSNNLKSANGVEKLTKMKTLNLRNNQIEFAKNFANAFHLKHLDLRGNPLKDALDLLPLIQNGTTVDHEDLASDDDVF
jgi:internalin A